VFEKRRTLNQKDPSVGNPCVLCLGGYGTERGELDIFRANEAEGENQESNPQSIATDHAL